MRVVLKIVTFEGACQEQPEDRVISRPTCPQIETKAEREERGGGIDSRDQCWRPTLFSAFTHPARRCSRHKSTRLNTTFFNLLAERV